MKGGRWEERIRRADALAVRYPFAAEGLRFYGHVASFQQTLHEALSNGSGVAKAPRPPGGLREELALFTLLPWFSSFLPFVRDIAPRPLSQAASGLETAGAGRWEEVLDELWRAGAAAHDLDPAEALIAWAFLQPYAEHLADGMARPTLAAESSPEEETAAVSGTPPRCPLCSGSPQVGVLRPLGDGGKRSLVCALCATEWDFRRIVCPACGEESVDKLPVYVAEELPHVRVEACDTCHRYIKTIDMTKDGHAVPVVDELAAIPLSLWAAEHEYEKVTANLLGL